MERTSFGPLNSLFAAAGPTVIVEVPLILVPVTETVASSALYGVIEPLDPAETVATSFVKLIGVTAPKLVAMPLELVTVGVNVPIAVAPVKVRLCESL